MTVAEAFDQLMQQVASGAYPPLVSVCLFIVINIAFVLLLLTRAAISFGPWVLTVYVAWKTWPYLIKWLAEISSVTTRRR